MTTDTIFCHIIRRLLILCDLPEASIHTVLRMTWNKEKGTMKKGMNIVLRRHWCQKLCTFLIEVTCALGKMCEK